VGPLGRSKAIAGLETLRLLEPHDGPPGPARLAARADGTLGQVGRLELDMPVNPLTARDIRARLPGVVVALRSEFR
jgi:hypothetical protein